MIGLRLGLGLQQNRPPAAEGGGGTPEWVPEGAVIHNDLVGGTPQGRAWLDGTGEVAVDTLLGTDPDSGASWGATGYDPAAYDALGYSQSLATPNDALGLIGALRTAVLANKVLVIRFQTPASGQSPTILLASADGNDAIQVAFNVSGLNVFAYSWGGSYNTELASVLNNSAEGSTNVIALFVSNDEVSYSVNGSDPNTAPIDENDRPPGNPFTVVLIETVTQRVASISIFEPGVSLSVLSSDV